MNKVYLRLTCEDFGAYNIGLMKPLYFPMDSRKTIKIYLNFINTEILVIKHHGSRLLTIKGKDYY